MICKKSWLETLNKPALNISNPASEALVWVSISDGRLVAIIIPNQIPRKQMDIVHAMVPSTWRLRIDLAKRMKCWGVISNREWDPKGDCMPRQSYPIKFINLE